MFTSELFPFLSVGLELFREFLRTEFSDENLEFWISCETYKNVSADLRLSHAQKLFGDFIAIQAPREVCSPFCYYKSSIYSIIKVEVALKKLLNLFKILSL